MLQTDVPLVKATPRPETHHQQLFISCVARALLSSLPNSLTHILASYLNLYNMALVRKIAMSTTGNAAFSQVAVRAFSRSVTASSSFKLPDLDYDYGELEPVISADIMKIHHSKHHQAYVNNLNVAYEKMLEAEKKQDVAQMIALQSAIKFNGGGHVNHSIFWKNLAPPSKGGGEPPKGQLATDINATFGSFEEFKTKFNTQTAAVQGSGWGWLAMNSQTKKLSIVTCPNQDPLSITGNIPLLGIDVWEHAYYLQYKNDRPGYLKSIWGIVNWADVEARYQAAK